MWDEHYTSMKLKFEGSLVDLKKQIQELTVENIKLQKNSPPKVDDEINQLCEHVEAMKSQLTIYEDDFMMERKDREKMSTKLNDLNQCVEELREQNKIYEQQVC